MTHLYFLFLANKNIIQVSKSSKESVPKSSNDNEPQSDIDEISKKLLEKFNPGLLEVVMPRKTIGDGNCLFRAVSIAVFKDDRKHADLRQKVFQEIKEHPEWYNKDHSKFCSPFANDNEIVLEDYNYYLENTPKLNEWCDINHILALSAVLEQPIESYFPPIHSIVSPFSRIIKGRGVKDLDEPDTKIKVMWTVTELPQQIKDFRPNHFVPLTPFCTINEGDIQGNHKSFKIVKFIN